MHRHLIASTILLVSSIAFADDTVSADAGGPYTVDAESTVTLDGSGSSADGDCASLQYRWDTTGDGAYDTSFASGSSTTFDAAGYDGPDSEAVTLQMRGECDGETKTDTDTSVVTIDNVAPLITSLVVPATDDEGSAVTVSVSFTDAEAADTHTVAWDFGDGATGSGSSTSHTWADDGTYTVTATVTDDDGGSDMDSGSIRIANVDPSIDSVTLPGGGDEGETLSFSVTASDPGDDTLSYAWDFGDGDAGSGRSVTHAYADNGTYAVELTVSDEDGGSAQASWTLTIDNVAPAVSTFTGDAAGNEGETLSWSVTTTDAGSADTLTVTWDFGDGSTASGSGASHSYDEDGTYTVTVTVCDDDGDCTSEDLTVSVSNAAPSITSLSGDTSGAEGSALGFSCSATDAGVTDTLSYAWSFGDGATATGLSTSHTFADDGSFTVTCEVSDDDGGVSSASLTAEVSNVAPSLEGAPGTDVQEGAAYNFAPSVVDPGSDDTHSWSGTLPADASLDGASGALAWTPGWADIGIHSLELIVADDDGGTDALSWDLEVLILDEDGDGLSDAWEDEYGLDSNDSADAASDPDGDGRTNAEEFAGGTDPTAYDGPSVPELASPADGGEFAGADVDLAAFNATSPVGEALLYDFAIYGDEAMSVMVASVAGVSEDPSGQTTWRVDGALVENTWYWWWASAGDAYTSSGWSAPWAFFYNIENEAPGAPGINAPFEGSTVSVLSPTLVLDEAWDPDGDPLTYSFVLTDADAVVVDAAADIGGDGTTASWTPDVILTDGESWCWHAIAMDDEGLEGEPSEIACFLVDTANQAPSAPSIVSPEEGLSVATRTPEVVLTNGVDPEGRSVVHVFELDTDPSYGSDDNQTASLAAGEDGTTVWTPEDLVDNAWYFVRALASDGGAYSDWAESSFFVDTENEAPSIPTLMNPIDGAAFGDYESLEIVNSTDPDGDEITYDFRILAADGSIAQQADGIEQDPAGSTLWTPDPLDIGGYTWSARAVDAPGLASDWADEQSFDVGAVEAGDTGGLLDTGVAGSEAPVPADWGCGCSSASNTTAPSRLMFPVVGMLLGLVGLRRRGARE